MRVRADQAEALRELAEKERVARGGKRPDLSRVLRALLARGNPGPIPARGCAEGVTLTAVRGARRRVLGTVTVVVLILASLAGIAAIILDPEMLWGRWGWAGLAILVIADGVAAFLVHKASPPSPLPDDH